VTDLATSLPLPIPPASVEAVLFLLLAAGVTALTAFAFVLWLGWLGIRGLILIATRLSLWPVSSSPRRPRVAEVTPCPDPVCRAINPSRARYCRQCGRLLRQIPRPPSQARPA
jgi:hypothetical protein